MDDAVSYSRRVLRICNIETTTHCNLRCKYCPSPKLEQLRGQAHMHMALDVYEQTLEWCAWYYERGTQGGVYLHGVGETTMHPEFETIIRRAREVMPDGDISMATNGVALTAEHCEVLRDHGVWLNVSLHRPEKAAKAVELASEYGVLGYTNVAAVERANDWAGQVDWHVAPMPPVACDWLTNGMVFVLVDGRITTCCFDTVTPEKVLAHVSDSHLIGTLEMTPIGLCNTCHMKVPDEARAKATDPEWATLPLVKA